MQDATENCYYPELFAEPLKLELNFIFPLERATELIVMRDRKSSVAVDKFGVVGKTSKMKNIFLQQKFNPIPLLKYLSLGSIPSEIFPFLPSETSAIIKTQPSKLQDEHWTMIANSRHKLYFTGCLSATSFLKR